MIGYVILSILLLIIRSNYITLDSQIKLHRLNYTLELHRLNYTLTHLKIKLHTLH